MGGFNTMQNMNQNMGAFGTGMANPNNGMLGMGMQGNMGGMGAMGGMPQQGNMAMMGMGNTSPGSIKIFTFSEFKLDVMFAIVLN